MGTGKNIVPKSGVCTTAVFNCIECIYMQVPTKVERQRREISQIFEIKMKNTAQFEFSLMNLRKEVTKY